MKRVLPVVVLVIVFAAAFWWFSSRNPNPPESAASTEPAENEKAAERREVFGADADLPGTEWRESGLGYRIVQPGTPPKPGIGASVKLIYTGRLKDGTVFDRSEKPSEFLIGATIPGLSVGVQMLGKGGKAVFLIPPSLAYGNRKVMGIPPNSGLIFEVEVVDIRP